MFAPSSCDNRLKAGFGTGGLAIVLSHHIRPAFTHAFGFETLQASSSSSSCQAAGYAVSHLVDDNRVIQVSISVGLNHHHQRHRTTGD